MPGAKLNIAEEWAKAEPLFRQLREDKRETIPFDSLGLKPKGGVANILGVYKQATPEERAYWGEWYIDASGVVQKMSDTYDVPLDVAAGVVAVLSPGNKWWINVRIAEKLMLFWKNNALDVIGPLSSYPRNINKAVSILESGDAHTYVTGPKVSIFFNSLIDPVGVQDDIVLDGHALNIWFGNKVQLKEVPNISADMRSLIEHDYQEAAKQLGVSVQSLQAITWAIWKSVGKGQARASYLCACLLVRAAGVLENT